MEVTLNTRNNKVLHDFWESVITTDKDFFEPVWDRYAHILRYLYNKMQAEKSSTIFLESFELPSELFDFLDGNGVEFTFDNEINKLRMRILPKASNELCGMRAKVITIDELPF